MPKPNVDVFLDLLARSGLVDKDQISRVLLEAGAAGKSPEDVDSLADQLVESGVITRWQADRLLEGRYKGFFLKQYKLLDQLGRGGMSMVYLGEHVLMHRRVAIKVLPRDRVEDSSYLARFHREAQAAAALDHRNIVRVYDVDAECGQHFMVMEYVDGRDLQHVVKQDGPVDYATAADYIRQAADGLAHAHDASLIHRDVKPANLLVDRNGVVKVLDMGLARFTDENRASLTVAYDENVLGTADYLPPEQAIDSHGVDARADLYGLGCSLYFLLTGHPPFPDGSLPQRLMAHQKQQPPSIFNDRPDAPQDLVDICMKMMAKKPDERHQTAREVSQTLARWLTEHGHKVRASDSNADIAVTSAVAAAPARAGRGGSTTRSPGDVRPAGDSSAKSVHGSGAAQRPRELTDTVSSLEHPTVKGAAWRGESLDKKGLPVAKPLEAPRPSEFVLDDGQQSPRSKRLPLTPEELARFVRRPPKDPPIWIYTLLGGGVILFLVLLLVFILRSL